MPPPDTIYIPGQTGPPPPTGNYYIDSVVQSHWKEKDSNLYQAAKVREGGSLSVGEIFWMLLFGFVLIAMNTGLGRFPELIRKRKREKAARKLIEAFGLKYHNWLFAYNPYYKSLSEESRLRFLQRTIAFANAKEFRFHYMNAEEYIPILISGAAVQLTFGLHNYMLNHFPTIHIVRKEYVRQADDETYYGHVSRSDIYISWNHFLAGYHDYEDSVNVGLHEMAHALQFDAYLGFEDSRDRNFKERLNDFSAEGRPIFRAMREGMSHVLDDYAMTNFDEFWAVSVETFFENPEAFKERLPVLYQEMCELLNQNPLLLHKVIDPDLL